MDSKATPTEQFKVQLPQWVQASNSKTCLVAILAELEVSLSITELAKRLRGLAKIWNILLKGR
jgi:hypothetical protein